jgi:predicted dehydrogenase
MTEDIRIGYVGCGAVVQRSHLPALTGFAGLRPETLVDFNEKQRMVLSEEYNVPITSNSLEDVLDTFDLGVIATPPGSHFELGKKLLKAGKHILMEKPLAVSREEGQELVEMSRDRGLVLAVSLVRRYLPHFRLFKQLMDMRVVGEVERFYVEEGAVFNWPVQSIDFYNPIKSGGGVLMDNGAHLIDAVLWWLGGAGLTDYQDDASGGVEADCELKLELSNGAKGEVLMSRLRNLANRIEVFGDQGQISMNLMSGVIEISGREFDGVLSGAALSKNGKGIELTTLDLFTKQYELIHSAIVDENEAGLVLGRDCLDSINIIQKCYEKKQSLSYLAR